MTFAALLIVLATPVEAKDAALQANRLLAEGDALWTRRAEGAQGRVAQPATIDAALAAYRRALGLTPASREARWRLLRALFFRGSFCGAVGKERLALFEEAREAGEAGVRALERSIAGGKKRERIGALRQVPEAAALYLWTAVSWGQWALYTGKVAAAWKGAAGKIRDYAEAAIELEPGQEQGAALILLGRLHDQSPKLPLLTPWVSRPKAIASLRRALEFGPDNSVALYFLAEALLHHAPERQQEARALLERCAALTPRPEYLVEDRHYVELARARLVTLPAAGSR
jgi:tetratricopeptide (TPR) repeat protein